MLKRNVKTGIGVILFVIFSFFTFASDPFLKVNIKEVSMFKNGYAFVVAEADVPGPGIYALPEFPGVVYGTLWITPESDSLKVKQIFKDTETTTHTNTTYHILHVLEKGIGKTFDLKLQSEGWLTAEILGTAGDEYLYAKTDKGVLIIKKQEILGLRLKDTKAIEDMKRVETLSNTAIRNKVEVTQGKGALKIRFLSQGMTWAPSYLVDIRDSGEAVISCKTLLLNTLEDVTEAKGFLIAGFPNIAFLSQEDPFTGGDVANVLQMGNYNARNLQSQTMYTQQNIASNVANFSEPVNNTAAIETGEMNADLYFSRWNRCPSRKTRKNTWNCSRKGCLFGTGIPGVSRIILIRSIVASEMRWTASRTRKSGTRLN